MFCKLCHKNGVYQWNREKLLDHHNRKMESSNGDKRGFKTKRYLKNGGFVEGLQFSFLHLLTLRGAQRALCVIWLSRLQNSFCAKNHQRVWGAYELRNSGGSRVSRQPLEVICKPLRKVCSSEVTNVKRKNPKKRRNRKRKKSRN